MTLEEFLQEVSKIKLPQNHLERMKILAKETAQGAFEKLWGTADFINNQTYREYVEKRWAGDKPESRLLVQYGYFSHEVGRSIEIEKPAIDLLAEVMPVNLFISYRRRESSAFALLVLARLKEFGLNAFLDMSLKPGDNWHAYIKEQIQHHEYFILLLGKETLASSVVKDEISWAIEAGAEIIPIWHNGFEYRDGAFDLSPEIQRVLRSNHSIRVLEESALAYNNAIVELLNRFGITP